MSEEQAAPETVPAAQLSPSEIAKKYANVIICCIVSSCKIKYLYEHFRLGNDAFLAKKYDEAIEHYSKGLLLDPENAVFYSNRRLYFQLLFLSVPIVNNVVLSIILNIWLSNINQTFLSIFRYSPLQCLLWRIETVGKGIRRCADVRIQRSEIHQGILQTVVCSNGNEEVWRLYRNFAGCFDLRARLQLSSVTIDELLQINYTVAINIPLLLTTTNKYLLLLLLLLLLL